MAGINQWAIGDNAGFAIALQSATPAIPDSQAYTLAWNPLTQLLSWVPVSIGAVTGDVAPAGHVNLAAAKTLRVGGLQVVGPRDIGWAAFTGANNESTTYATGTITLIQLAERVAGMQVALTAHGLIGT